MKSIKAADEERRLPEKRALLIFNPMAGENRALRNLPDTIRHMTEHGYLCTSLTTTYSGAATDYILSYGAENDVVICSGGDGTANEVIRGMMQLKEEDRPIFGYIPT